MPKAKLPVLTKAILEDLEKVIQDRYEDEKEHFEGSDSRPKDHIFRSLKRLREWIDGA